MGNSEIDGHSFRENSRQFKVRIGEKHLMMLTGIQGHLKRCDLPTSMEYVLNEGIETLYRQLEDQGFVPQIHVD